MNTEELTRDNCPDCYGSGLMVGASDDHGHYGTSEPCRSCDGTGKEFDWNNCPSDPKRRPEFFRRLFPRLSAAAKKVGYTLTSHGSMERDFDLVAVPWTENAVSGDELAKSIQLRACGSWGAWKTEEKPHGRVGYVLHIATDVYIDLSVMRRTGDMPAPTNAAPQASVAPSEEGVEGQCPVIPAAFRVPMWLVGNAANHFAAWPRKTQAEVYASGFRVPPEIIEGEFIVVGTLQPEHGKHYAVDTAPVFGAVTDTAAPQEVEGTL
jgi:hypothetical protein